MHKLDPTLLAELECIRYKDGQHKVEFSTADGSLWRLPLRDFVRLQPLMRWEEARRVRRVVRKMHVGLLALHARRESMAAAAAAQAIADQAAAKRLHVYHCVPMTGTTDECWLVQRGYSMRCVPSLDDLAAAVRATPEYTPAVAAAEKEAFANALHITSEVTRHG